MLYAFTITAAKYIMNPDRLPLAFEKNFHIIFMSIMPVCEIVIPSSVWQGIIKYLLAISYSFSSVSKFLIMYNIVITPPEPRRLLTADNSLLGKFIIIRVTKILSGNFWLPVCSITRTIGAKPGISSAKKPCMHGISAFNNPLPIAETGGIMPWNLFSPFSVKFDQFGKNIYFARCVSRSIITIFPTAHQKKIRTVRGKSYRFFFTDFTCGK